MIDTTEEIPNRATFNGVSIVYPNPITGIWKVWGKSDMEVGNSILIRTADNNAQKSGSQLLFPMTFAHIHHVKTSISVKILV